MVACGAGSRREQGPAAAGVPGAADGKGKMPLVSLLGRKKGAQIILASGWKETSPVRRVSGTGQRCLRSHRTLRSVLPLTKVTPSALSTGEDHGPDQGLGHGGRRRRTIRRRAEVPRLLEQN